MSWYNKKRVDQPGSVILAAWNKEREKERALIQNSAQVPAAEITRGSDMYDFFAGGQVAGVSINEKTAMRVSAVYASVNLIGGSIASLPLHVYQKSDNGRTKATTPISRMLNLEPWPGWSAATAWEFALASLLLQGDSFWRIHRKRAEVSGLEPLHPQGVQVCKNGNRLAYVINLAEGERLALDQDDILHIPGAGFDGLRGMSPIRFAALRTAGGLAMAADEYSASFFANGARPDFVLSTPGNLSLESADLLRSTWASRHQGPSNAHLPAVLTGGMEVKQITLSAQDAQLIETRRFQVEDIARIFGVPPDMIAATGNASGWGTGIEQRSIGFVKFTLGRLLVKFEQELNRKLFSDPRQFAEFSTVGLERGDTKTRNESYRIAIGRAGEPGWLTQNEVRAYDNLPPLPGGDQLHTGAKDESAKTPIGK